MKCGAIGTLARFLTTQPEAELLEHTLTIMQLLSAPIKRQEPESLIDVLLRSLEINRSSSETSECSLEALFLQTGGMVHTSLCWPS
jgi:hypothetical protein